MLHPEDQAKLQYVLDWVRGFSGDNVQNLGNTVYVGSGPQRQQPGIENWAPRQFRVKSEENDYLVCVPYSKQADAAGEREYKVAKSPDRRGDTVRKGAYPIYVPDETIIWAAPFPANGATDADNNNLLLMEMNPDGRSSAWFMGEITSSSSSSDDHTFAEIDGEGTQITDGRTATDAKAMNGRRGIPTGTKVFIIDTGPSEAGGDPRYWFTVGEGQTGTTKDLTTTGHSADTTEFDVEDQGGTFGALYSTARAWITSGVFSVFSRDITTDASGDTYTLGTETRRQLLTASEDSPRDDHVCGVASGNASMTVKLNQPQADHNTLIFRPGTGIEINSSTADVDVEVDDSGRLLLAQAVAGNDQVIEIEATGGSVDPEDAVLHKTFWVVVENGAANATVTLDNTNDWRGRTIFAGNIYRYDGTEANALTATTWSNQTGLGGATTLGANRATSVSIVSGSGYELKVSTGGDLQFAGVDVAASDQHYYVTITASARITARTHEIT